MMPQPIPTDAEFWRGYYGGRKPMVRGNSFYPVKDWAAAPRITLSPNKGRIDIRNIRVLDGTRAELEAEHEAEVASWKADLKTRLGRLDSERATTSALRKTIDAERADADRRARRSAHYGLALGAAAGSFVAVLLLEILPKLG